MDALLSLKEPVYSTTFSVTFFFKGRNKYGVPLF